MHTIQELSCNSAFVLPRNCTFSETDWKALAPFWYPIAFSHQVTDRPFAAKVLDERLVLFRHSDSSIVAARDLCLHRGVALSLGWVENDELQCQYHGIGYDKSGQCTRIPPQPDAAIPARLKLTTYAVTERYGLVWVRLMDNGSVHFPYFQAWNDPDYIQVLPASVAHEAAAGRHVEGFLDVSHFAFVHTESFGERENQEVPDYPVERLPHGFRADDVSTVSNYPHNLKHLSPPGFKWRRLFEVWLPFTAKLSVTFGNGQLHILNAACPV